MVSEKQNSSVDPNTVRNIKLGVGILLLLSAAMNLLFDNSASLSSGRWSWVYNIITDTFGIHAYAMLKVVGGVFCIAMSANNKSRNT